MLINLVQPYLRHRFLRFLAVGALNAIFGYGCYAVFLYLGLHYSLAVLVSTILGILFNFFTTGRLVFASHDNRRLFHFFAVYVIVYVINVGGLRILSEFGADPYYGGAALILPMAALAYFLNKKLVFKNA